MNTIKAVGFDLFNTLISMGPEALDDARGRLINSLRRSGLPLDRDSFLQAYRQSALEFLEKARQEGRETHNRFWISVALHTQGWDIHPDDPGIAAAVDAYFAAFLDHCRLVPDTVEMLETMQGRYRLGLLSNFTHGPAARQIIDKLGITRFFDVVLISDELGYRKPTALVFDRLIEGLGFENHQILYVGDDPECDIMGARQAGLQPVWTTLVRDQNLPVALTIAPGAGEMPEEGVPRISRWKDLISLLDGS